MDNHRKFYFNALLIFVLFLSSASAADAIQTKVLRVVDGDTIVVNLNGKSEKVRLIGVDTPETVDPRRPVQYFGNEASTFTKRQIEGKRVRLDIPGPARDRYNRILAYVYRESDNFFLNYEIVKQGYGHAYTKYPFKYMDEFRQAERKARESGRGLWTVDRTSTAPQKTEEKESQRGFPVETLVYINKSGAKYHLTTCQYLKKNKIPVSLVEAKKMGKTPCKICNPPK